MGNGGAGGNRTHFYGFADHPVTVPARHRAALIGAGQNYSKAIGVPERGLNIRRIDGEPG